MANLWQMIHNKSEGRVLFWAPPHHARSSSLPLKRNEIALFTPLALWQGCGGRCGMATFRKRSKGWEAQVRRRHPYPVAKSATFPTRAQAVAWALKVESELHTIRSGQIPRHTLKEAAERYQREVSSTKRGEVWEGRRLEALGASKMGSMYLDAADSSAWAAWRDTRLAEVSPGTVLREANLYRNLYTIAVREWRWASSNPLAGLRMPPQPPARTRLPTEDEFERLALAFGDDLTTQTGRVWAAFKFACLTAMRAGEIVGLTWDRIIGPVASLPMTKNGSARRVPLSAEARAILDQLPRDGLSVFGLESAGLDALWRKGRQRAGVDGLRFHDSRAYAITTLARKVDILTLARISGHRDLKMLQGYYRESAEDIAGRI